MKKSYSNSLGIYIVILCRIGITSNSSRLIPTINIVNVVVNIMLFIYD